MLRRSHAVLALVALFALVTLVVSGCGGKEDAGTTSGTQEGTQTSTETTPSADTGIGEGQLPPEFVLPDLDGNDVMLADYDGKVVVLDLWATWCPPCREEIPFLVQLYDEFRDQGLMVVGIGLDQGGAPTLAPFAEANGITYPILVGDRDVQAAYGVTGIPTTFIIGRDGRIVSKHVGYHPSMAESFRDEIRELLSGSAEA